MGCNSGCSCISHSIRLVCGSAERKYISVENDRGAGKSESHRYRLVWNSTTPDVCGDIAIIFIHAIVLGSVISFIVFLAYPFIIAGRIKNEEKVLEEGLAGYKEYKQKVKYRLVPFIW